MHLVSVLSCNIFSYKRMMSVYCVQIPSAGKRVTGPSYLFSVRCAGVTDFVFMPALARKGEHTPLFSLCAPDLALLFFSV